MVLLQCIIAIYNYAVTQNTFSDSIAFIPAFYSMNYCHVISPMKKESSFRVRNFREISVSRWVGLRFHIIRLQGKKAAVDPFTDKPLSFLSLRYTWLCCQFLCSLILYPEKSERTTNVRTKYNFACLRAI